ncbi:MAG: C4-dicarboxylate ABC transporter substrate-binding protein [Betaproteobacteria bacterium]|nr:C4-dicarboxylate ABC transporter substrate-binding protein [Betaproteobacteria bacterium]
MAALRSGLLSLRDLLATAWPILLVSMLGFVVAYQFVEPAPPRQLTLTTGGESGAYYLFGKRYAEILARNGVALEVKTSAGSYENLDRIGRGEADAALVQGGIPAPGTGGDESSPSSLGSVAYEPVWVFYRGERTFDKLHQLAGLKIAVGAEGSGVRGLALQLLSANEMATDSKRLLPLAGLKAAEALQQGGIDAAFIIAAPEAPVVQVLLRSPGVRVMSFSQADAYTRRFPFLSKIVLPHGVIDLVRDNPPQDTVLLATTANLIVSDSLHPALASLLLQAMGEVHGKSGFFQAAGEFPAYKDHSFELSEDARRHYKSGPPFLQRYLPFWVAVLAERMFVMLLPFFALLLPLLKVAPAVYTWRVRRKIFRCYGDLKFLENDIRQHYEPAQHLGYLERLDRIEEEAKRRNIPLAFTDLLYTLREHINFVRQRLRHLETAHSERAG